MSLNLKSTGGGGVILTPASTATDITVTVPATASTLLTRADFGVLGNYANDAAAAAGGVAIGGLYRNGSVVQVRVA
jgi:hypothetical protein